ncbi:MAG: hypothetical protein IKU36_01830 [Bacteroidales bacterium]|nr:hypothetical protein [Bacteroidales bacterium]
MNNRFSRGASITVMLEEFAKYSGSAESLALLWDTSNDDPEELCKLNVIRCFVNTCAEMLEDIKESVESEMPYYGGEGPSE